MTDLNDLLSEAIEAFESDREDWRDAWSVALKAWEYKDTTTHEESYVLRAVRLALEDAARGSSNSVLEKIKVANRPPANSQERTLRAVTATVAGAFLGMGKNGVGAKRHPLGRPRAEYRLFLSE